MNDDHRFLASGLLQDQSIAQSLLGALPQIIHRELSSKATSLRVASDSLSLGWSSVCNNSLISTTFRDTFDTVRVSEAVAVRLLAYFKGDDDKYVLPEQFSPVEVYFYGVSPDTSDQGSWLHVVQALLSIFLTDEELREAHDSVARAEQIGR